MSSSLANVVIVGGGNAAHVLAGLGGSMPERYRLSVLTSFGDEAERWNRALAENGGEMTVDRVVDGKKERLTGRPARVTADAAEVVPDADLVLLSLPSNCHMPYLEAIGPHLRAAAPGRPPVVVAAMPGYAFFDVFARHALGTHAERSGCVFAALETLPWACRLSSYGRSADILGTKGVVEMAADPPEHSGLVRRLLSGLMAGPRPEIHAMGAFGFLEITLMNINATWHPTIVAGRFERWDWSTPFDEAPLFYEGVDQDTADLLDAVSNEIGRVRDAIESRFAGRVRLTGVRHVSEWMRRSYGGAMADESSLCAMIRTNRGYLGLRHAMKPAPGGAGAGLVPNFAYRYMTEDVPCGILPVRGVAELAGVPTPAIDRVLRFCERALGRTFIGPDGRLLRDADSIRGTRTPQALGLDTLEQLMSAVTGHEGEAFAAAAAAGRTSPAKL